ncbi:MOSC domain-containing protein [Halorussus halophilus]|uniref:MOSC domain-containing protein n=1 Tax=Halorussus halophilus TaxID=2650975 RepID=UPI001300D09C|nr:MOSC domain-containing protein [Halorussus halophilus]
MNGTGTVEAIHVAAEEGEATEGIESVEAVAGEGLRGDRKFGGDSFDLSLIEQEAIDAVAEDGIEMSDGEHRRQITTSDAALNHLVGERFRVGEVVCEGIELCEPCSHLESLTEKGAVSAFLHRGGLNAEILESGTIRAGDEIEKL